MAFCCGVCVEDVGDVLGNSCDSWIGRRMVVFYMKVDILTS